VPIVTQFAVDEQSAANDAAKARPYSPSWVDYLTAWVTALPVPRWSFYVGLGLLLLVIQGTVLWIEGAFSFPTIHRGHVFLAAAVPFFLALIHFLDERAGMALTAMRSDLKASEAEFQELHYRLTTLPAMATLLAGLVALGCPFLIEVFTGTPYRLEELLAFPISASLLRVFYLLCWWVFGAFVYHTFHQLTMINLIYTEFTRINLFRMKSLYAFSNLAALTAGGMVVIPYSFLLANEYIEAIRQDLVILSVYLVITFFALVTFFWPQLGIHRLQVIEKERMLEEANRRFEATIGELHAKVDTGEFDAMSNLNVAMLNLELERSALGKVRTWPWEPDTVRLLITALAMPLGLWLVQFLLQRLLGS
jgi:hypothetical protein